MTEPTVNEQDSLRQEIAALVVRYHDVAFAAKTFEQFGDRGAAARFK